MLDSTLSLYAQYFCLGFTNEAPTIATMQYLGSRNVTDAGVEETMTVIVVPWALKFIWGAAMDMLALENRSVYLISASYCIVVLWGIIAHAVGSSNFATQTTVILLFSAQVLLSIIDVALDGTLVDYVQRHESLSHIQPSSYTARAIGRFVGGLAGASLVSRNGPVWGYIIVLFPMLGVLSLNLFPREPPIPPENDVRDQATAPAPETSAYDKKEKRGILLRLMAFICIVAMCPSAGSAVYFYMNEVVRLTPFEQGLMMSTGHLFSAVGNTLYKLLNVPHIPLRKYYSVLILIVATLSSVPILVVSGIVHDKVWAIALTMGDHSMQTVVGEMYLLPFLVVLAKNAPTNWKAGSYALGVSALNLAGGVSGLLGAAAISVFGVDHYKYANITALLAFCVLVECIASFGTLRCLVTDKSTAEVVSDDKPEVGTLVVEDETVTV